MWRRLRRVLLMIAGAGAVLLPFGQREAFYATVAGYLLAEIVMALAWLIKGHRGSAAASLHDRSRDR